MGNKRDKRQKFRKPRGKWSNFDTSLPSPKHQYRYHHEHGRSQFRPSRGPAVTSRLIRDSDKIGPSISAARYKDLSEATKSITLVERVKELFSLRFTSDGILEMGREPSIDTVRLLADEIVNMWPKDWKQADKIDDGENGFKLLFWGPQLPNSVGNAITRASLYADKILVVNPFTDSMLHHPAASPLVQPHEWISVYAMDAIFVALLEPWIKAGIVELVQNPVYFNAQLMHSMKDEAMQKPLPSDEGTQVEMVTEMCLQMNEVQAEGLLKHPEFPAPFARKVREHLAMHRKEPVRVRIPQNLSQITKSGSGMAYGHARLLAAQSGATIFSHTQSYCRQLQSNAEELRTPFQKAAIGFSRTQLSFLNNVPTDFAVGIRQDGKLEKFRQYLTALVSGIQSPVTNFSDEAIKSFEERLLSEYADYGNEWKDIQKKLGVKALAGAASAAATGAAIATGAFPIAGFMAATFGGTLMTLIETVFDRRKLNRRPLGMMLKLDNS